MFYYKGFAYDYSREAENYLRGKSGVYRVDYYQEFDGIADVGANPVNLVRHVMPKRRVRRGPIAKDGKLMYK